SNSTQNFAKEVDELRALPGHMLGAARVKKDSEVSKSEKKRVAEEALLQESFKKLRTAQASGSEPSQEQLTEEPKRYTTPSDHTT
ncbi:hypothetical protein Tco_1266493, partial [Tanacetum coccineum]